MKVRVCGKDFKKLVDRVKVIALKNGYVPCLSSVLFEARDEKLIAKTSNLEAYGAIEIPAFVIEPGFAAVAIDDIVKVTGIADEITIEADGAEFDVYGKKKSYSVINHATYKESFPEFPELPNQEIAVMHGDKLIETFSLLVPMTSCENANKMLTVMNFNTIIGNITALDSHRIGVRKLAATECKAEKSVNIPAFTYSHLKAIADKKSMISIRANEKYVAFVGDDYTYIAKAVEGEYFRYEKMIGDESYYDYSFNIEAAELGNIAKEYYKIIKGENKKPMCVMNRENHGVQVGVVTSDYKTSDHLESVKDLDGMNRDWEFAMNPKFIFEAMQMFKGEAKIMGKYSHKTPIICKNDEFTSLILPVNLDSDAPVYDYVQRTLTRC